MAERGPSKDIRQRPAYLSLTKEEIAGHIARIRELSASLTDLCLAGGCEKDVVLSAEQAMMLVTVAQSWAIACENIWLTEGVLTNKAAKH